MGIIKLVKGAATTARNAVTACCTESSRGLPGGCPCDFLDQNSPTTADVQAGQKKGK